MFAHLFYRPLKKTASHTLFIRLAWLALTVFTVIFCGPVKRAIERRLDNAGITCTTDASRHLKTHYREKRDTAPTIHFSIQQSPDNGFGPILASASISIRLLSRQDVLIKNLRKPAAITAALPLYLHCRKLQV